jgi:hypothetical protein
VGSVQSAVNSVAALDRWIHQKPIVHGAMFNLDALPTAHCPLPTVP